MRSSRHITAARISDSHFLLLNGLTGAVDIVREDIAKVLKEEEGIESLQPEEVQGLLDRGYLFSDLEEEKALIDQIASAFLPKRRMLRFSISPTYACNFRCSYCFEKDRLDVKYPTMSLDDVDRAFTAIDQITSQEPDIPSLLTLFGGEPLLPANKPVITKIFQLAAARRMPITIATNGVNVPIYEEEIKALEPGMINTQITLDGPPEVHDKRRVFANGDGSFYKIARSVSFLLENGIPVNLRMNVDAQNLPYLSKMVDLVYEYGWNRHEHFVCGLAPVADHTGCGRNQFYMEEWELLDPIMDLLEADPRAKKLLEVNMFRTLSHLMAVLEEGKSVGPRLFYCEANNLEAFEFGPEGLIYACSECMGNSKHAIGRYAPDFTFFKEQAEAWGKRNVTTIDKCRECEVAFLCGGGCAYSALSINGSLFDPYCGDVKHLIEAYLTRVGAGLLARIHSTA